jgi:hypothetical protein
LKLIKSHTFTVFHEETIAMKKVVWMIALALAVLVAIPPHSNADGTIVVSGHHGSSGHRHWRGHTGFHFYWGGPLLFGPWWYPYGDNPYRPGRVIPAPAPPVFTQPAPQPEDYWYYCQDPQGYYPYVQNCPGGWIKVVPEAPKQ